MCTESATIFDWISHSRLTLDTIDHSFFKVAHMLPVFAQNLGSEIIYESVYMDLSEQAKISPTQLPILAGWRMLYVCNNDDLITRPVLQKITQAEPEGSIFPSDAAYICIQDTRVLAKNYLTASGLDRESFIAYCTQAMQEILTVAYSAGQPAESGLTCCETGETKVLDLTHTDAIKLVISQRDKLKKSLKDNMIPLVDSQDRIHMEGFALDGMNSDEIIPYISSITGLTTWNGQVTSIAFASDGSGKNLYQWKALLTLLANRILKLVKKHDFKWSLVDLFPEQYESLPEHFVAIACAMHRSSSAELVDGHTSWTTLVAKGAVE
ncbi:hypothetical protein BD769DRAFT_1391302 [Suillus cothurnatus]|nr:hypothetical protein BD769DRAFT_1391302 [Suillus cothurnatus]